MLYYVYIQFLKSDVIKQLVVSLLKSLYLQPEALIRLINILLCHPLYTAALTGIIV